MKTDVVIIGSGLVGSMTSRYLESKGLETVIVDSQHKMSASKCSFGVWKEGWVNKLIRSEYEDGLDFLQEVTGGVRDVEFLIKPKPYKNRSLLNKYKVDQSDLKTEIFKKVDCSLILKEKFVEGVVEFIDKNRVVYKDIYGKDQLLVGKKGIVVAAGVWTTDLLLTSGLTDNLPYLDFQWGSVFRLRGTDLPQDNQMAEWSPYKQSVYVLNGKKGALFGDGAVIKNPKKDDSRIPIVSDRILIHMNDLIGKGYAGNISEILEGYRPYLSKEKSHTGKFVNQHSDYVFSATGGAKNSTILCSHMAKQVYRIMKEGGRL